MAVKLIHQPGESIRLTHQYDCFANSMLSRLTISSGSITRMGRFKYSEAAAFSYQQDSGSAMEEHHHCM